MCKIDERQRRAPRRESPEARQPSPGLAPPKVLGPVSGGKLGTKPRRVSHTLMACAAGWLALAAPAHAQRGDVRYGPWVTAGVGPAFTGVRCTGCPTGQTLGISGFLEIGGTPSEKITVGINGSGWLTSGSDTTRSILSVTALMYFFPSVEQRSFFVKFGGGAARYSETSSVRRLSSNGFVITAGGGYEIPSRGHIHFAPYVGVTIAPSQRAKRNLLAVDERMRLWVVSGGVSLTWRR